MKKYFPVALNLFVSTIGLICTNVYAVELLLKDVMITGVRSHAASYPSSVVMNTSVIKLSGGLSPPCTSVVTAVGDDYSRALAVKALIRGKVVGIGYDNQAPSPWGDVNACLLYYIDIGQ
ncbi:hypothetical protein CCP4SC76_1220007 [Gammaproteobacteria bacterium]